MQVELRPASRDDVNELMSLLNNLCKGDIGQHSIDILSEYINSKNCLVTVAVLEDSIAGVLIGSYRLEIDYECRAGFVDAVMFQTDDLSDLVKQFLWAFLRFFTSEAAFFWLKFFLISLFCYATI